MYLKILIKKQDYKNLYVKYNYLSYITVFKYCKYGLKLLSRHFCVPLEHFWSQFQSYIYSIHFNKP